MQQHWQHYITAGAAAVVHTCTPAHLHTPPSPSENRGPLSALSQRRLLLLCTIATGRVVLDPTQLLVPQHVTVWRYQLQMDLKWSPCWW